MLEQIRKSGASIFIYLIFGLLIVIFVINFAPNAGSGQGGGCSGPSTAAITLDGVKTSPASYKVAYSGNQGTGRSKTYLALEILIRRELLAQAAEKRGLRANGDMLDHEIGKGVFFLGGNRNALSAWMDEIEGEKFFNFTKLKGWVGSLNVSMNSYKEEQTRGMQAAMMAELLQDSVRVSRDEALSSYLFQNNTVSYDTVTFSPSAYRDAMRLTDADLARFVAGHEAEVKTKWTEVEREYKATKPALKLRSIFIAVAPPAPAPATPPADTSPSGIGPVPPASRHSPSGGAPVTPTAPPPTPAPAPAPEAPTVTPGAPVANPAMEAAKAKLEAARVAIAAGRQKFPEAAARLSSDDAARAASGAIGWRPVENARMGDKAVNDAIKTLKPGEMTPVIVTEDGVYLVTAEDQREGDLTFDQVKHELAVDLAKQTWSQEAAKRAALDALNEARSGTGKNLDQLFERAIKADPSRMQIEEIERQIREQQGKQGAIVTESKDIPAAWTAEDPAPLGAGAGGGGSSAADSATPPSAGSAAAGSAAAGTAAAGTPAEPIEPVVAAPLVASADVLPAFGEIVKPKVETHGPVPRMRALPGVGESKDAIAALFDELSAGMLAQKVYETSDSFVVVQLSAKQAPKVDDFDKVADKEIEALRGQRATILVEQWLKQQCEALAKAGKITPMAELIRETDDQGKPLPVAYRPCMSFR